MAKIPDSPKIYHITHVDNLPRIVHAGEILCDAKMLALGAGCTVVGMSKIKQRRLEEIEVSCHRGTKVGDYVPFYFCPRSVMLYILHRGNHAEVAYQGGQQPIVHLQADLRAVLEWAEAHGRRWAFSDRNAGAHLANFFKRIEDLEEVNWGAVASTDFRDSFVKEGKQAEFLMHGSLPWERIERIGVVSAGIQAQVVAAIGSGGSAGKKPLVTVEPGWYY